MNIDLLQKQICDKYFTDYIPSPDNFKIGISKSALDGIQPLNGFRHEITGDTTGWYIWGGVYSDSPDFFMPMHVMHLSQQCPLIMKFLGLPPGYRFLINDKGYEDVWYDESLLTP